MYVERLSIRNFRGLTSVDLALEPDVTLLVGRNNSGKSRILRALALALGADAVQLDDLTVDGTTSAEIDVVVAPAPTGQEDGSEVFTTTVARRLNPVQTLREEPARERFAWRTSIMRSAEGFGARADSRLLTFDAEAQEWVLAATAPPLTREHRSVVATHLVETNRDLVDELTRRGSAVRRVLSDLEVPADQRDVIERQLDTLGRQIVSGSSTLGAVTEALDVLEQTVGTIGKPALNPLPLRLEELARSVALDLDVGTGALPIRLHGAGARSLASLQVQSVLYDRRLGVDGTSVRPHPVTLLEEPEAHLHPQATFELAELLHRTRGQVVASTHSSHLVTTIEPGAIRLIRPEDGVTVIVDLHPVDASVGTTSRARHPQLHSTEMEKLKRLVERPFGELLFASAVVIGDGATERAFLPPVLRRALGARGHGVCVVDPGSMSNTLASAAVKFGTLVGIPWVLFCDADEDGERAAKALVDAHGGGDMSLAVFGGTAAEGPQRGATEAMLLEFDEELCRTACLTVRPNLEENLSTLDMLRTLKGSAGSALAHELLAQHPEKSMWPTPLQQLVRRLEELLP